MSSLSSLPQPSPAGGPRLVPGDDYREVNRAYWNCRAPAHAASPGYGVQRFKDDATFLSDEATRGFTGTMIGISCVDAFRRVLSAHFDYVDIQHGAR